MLFFCFIFLSYTILITLSIIGWTKTIKQSAFLEPKNYFFLSVIIPTRNESDNIERIIAEVLSQNYSQELFELIIIDDQSEDTTFYLASSYSSSNKNLKVIKSTGTGKKAAIKEAIRKANGDYIVQTDADCYIPSNWLKTINTYLSQHQPKLLAAPVLIKNESHWFSKIQMLDFTSLMASTAGFIGIKRAIMLNAANLIYQKDLAFSKNYLNNKSASGDDMFLLHAVKKEYGSSEIHYLNSKEATVETKALGNLNQLFHQRIRWASKSKYYKDADTLISGSIIFITNLSLIISFIGSFFSVSILSFFMIVFLFKALFDLLLLIPILKFYNHLKLLIYFPILSLIYPFYVSFVGLLSPFVSFKWKNRTLK